MRLEGGVDGGGRLGQHLVDDVEKRLKIGGVGNITVAGVLSRCLAFPAGGVKNRQVEEGFGGGRGLGVVQRGSQFKEEVLGFLHHLVDAGVGAVGLIYHDNDGHFGSQGLAQHEPGLRQWPLGGVDKQYHTIDHGEPTFDFAAEIGVTRGINDVNDEIIAVFAQPLAANGGVFRENRNAFFLLQITRVHDAISNFPVVTKDAGLLQHGVHEGGFTMVDVRDNGDITKLWMRQRVLLGERK